MVLSIHTGLSHFSRRDDRCHTNRVFRRENGTVPLGVTRGSHCDLSVADVSVIFRVSRNPLEAIDASLASN